jgi:cytochrome P450
MTASAPSLPPLHMRRDAFDPSPALGEIRRGPGVQTVVNSFGMTVYLVTRHDDVKRVLSDHEHFSNARPPEFVIPGAPVMPDEELASARAGNLLGLDPPEHQRLRRMLTPEFTIRRIKRLEPRITEIVSEHLDAMEAAGPPADLVEHFALPIPSLVICELLGVPYEDRADFQARSTRQLDLSLPIADRFEVQRRGRAYMQSLVARARSHPGEDILGMLIREHGAEVTDDELVGIAGLLLLAGHETTSNMLGLGTLALLRHPDQLAAVRDDPDAIGPAVEELLRWLSIVHSSIPRITTTDVEVASVPIPAGQLVFASLPSGNRDPEFTDAPDILDIRRGAPGHLAFGHGVHHCLGAPLARMEMRIAWPALLHRFPNLALAEDFEDIQFRSFHFIYGLRSLAVRW